MSFVLTQSLSSKDITHIYRVPSVLIVIDLISRGLNLHTLHQRHDKRRDLITRLRDSGLTHQKIADRLNEMGFPKTNGTVWTRFDVGVSLKKIRDRKKREDDKTVILSVVKALLE